jgi:hypothetical protein
VRCELRLFYWPQIKIGKWPSARLSVEGDTMGGFLLHAAVGLVITLASTFSYARSAKAIYQDVMGCEAGCEVVATGWPFIFVRDYLGMSVVKRADIFEVWFASDRFDWMPFMANVIIWALTSIFLGTLVAKSFRGP